MRYMEISIVDKSTIKIKGKNVSFIVSPTSSMSKTPADVVLFLKDLDNADSLASKVAEARVMIKGPGSYEIGGARVSAVRAGSGLFYSINIDGLNISLGNTTGAQMLQDIASSSVLVLDVDSDFKETMISSFEPSVAVLFGDKADAALKLLGKEHQTVSKFTQSADKLPTDLQVVLLK